MDKRYYYVRFKLVSGSYFLSLSTTRMSLDPTNRQLIADCERARQGLYTLNYLGSLIESMYETIYIHVTASEIFNES